MEQTRGFLGQLSIRSFFVYNFDKNLSGFGNCYGSKTLSEATYTQTTYNIFRLRFISITSVGFANKKRRHKYVAVHETRTAISVNLIISYWGSRHFVKCFRSIVTTRVKIDHIKEVHLIRSCLEGRGCRKKYLQMLLIRRTGKVTYIQTNVWDIKNPTRRILRAVRNLRFSH